MLAVTIGNQLRTTGRAGRTKPCGSLCGFQQAACLAVLAVTIGNQLRTTGRAGRTKPCGSLCGFQQAACLAVLAVACLAVMPVTVWQ